MSDFETVYENTASSHGSETDGGIETDADENHCQTDNQTAAVSAHHGQDASRLSNSFSTSHSEAAYVADPESKWFEKESLLKFIAPFSMCLIGINFVFIIFFVDRICLILS